MIEHAGNGLRVTAPMLIVNARSLLEAGRHYLRSGRLSKQVVLDLVAVSEVDSSALSIILAWLRTASEYGINLRMANPPANLISLATLYGVAELLPLT